MALGARVGRSGSIKYKQPCGVVRFVRHNDPSLWPTVERVGLGVGSLR